MVLHGSAQTPDHTEGEHRQSDLQPSQVAPTPSGLPSLSTDRDTLAISADEPTQSGLLARDPLANRDLAVSQASADCDLVSSLAPIVSAPGLDLSDVPLGGFQDAPLRDNSFDVAVSNVP